MAKIPRLNLPPLDTEQDGTIAKGRLRHFVATLRDWTRYVDTTLGDAPTFYRGVGSPNGRVAAAVGSLYTRTDGGAATTLYVKEAGTGTAGWVAK